MHMAQKEGKTEGFAIEGNGSTNWPKGYPVFT